MIYNIQRDRLLGKPSIDLPFCPFCGEVATNRHHIIPKGMGGTKHGKEIPTIRVCGMGNTSGCHKKLHTHELELDWQGDWVYRRNGGEWMPLKYR